MPKYVLSLHKVIFVLSILLPLAASASINPGLPDFTDLVEEVSPAVVSITVTHYGESTPGSQEEIPEIFRRFFNVPEQRGRGAVPPQRPPEQERFRPQRQGGGSGFIISAEGYIVTNHHVVDAADKIVVKLADNREFEAKIVGSDEMSDIALLKIETDNLPSLRFGNSDALKRGQWVIAIGSPFSFEQSVTAGIISAKGRANGAQQYVPFIQTDVAINRGNSGGPLLNMDGEVVGVNSWILSSGGGYIGLSFSIPINVANRTIEQLREHGKVSRGLLGVGIQGVQTELAAVLKLDRPRGALVNRIEKGKAADRAGVEIGDVILEFNDQPIEDFTDLPPLIGAIAPNTKVQLLLNRSGEQKNISVKLDELLTDAIAAADPATNDTGLSNVLGLLVGEIDENVRRQNGIPKGGVLVREIESESAWRAGIRRGDIVLRINRGNVDSLTSFNKLVQSIRAGESVALLVVRNGNPNFVAYQTEAK
ncbi:MAG: DegQ family serine endoprotease [Xanthomonadales bacterium]|nr:DegQ family serine endoprotease [Xanthomonadales bacterium]